MEECYLLKPATLLKVTLLHECFSRFLNCTNCIKLRKTSHIKHKNSYEFVMKNISVELKNHNM